ncbi:methyl-accepting chemotaxis protein [Anaerocolumna xylanovorans]|uniref:Methyl-accepting chemotaxis protein n=1 Tax=Anaerocolumna xylanovorans DSM 12503 TaxID=1121345 RepID=A0A1M7YGA3_9FIRM|nr:methyl-accepting chemotaxis protein [Anaerocolumna xylanovorans]SHO51599.1 methyl-accepting chemotaxis protein [Anaerocolumna xylanovorans DSM 12503]
MDAINQGEKVRKFNEKKERNKVINKFIFLGTTILYALYIGVLVGNCLSKEIPFILAVILIVLCCLATGINAFTFMKKATSNILGWGSLTSYMIIYSIFLFSNGSSFVRISAIPVLVAVILFYDTKLVKIFCIWNAVINIIYSVLLVMSKSDNMLQNILELIIILLTLNTIYKCTDIGHRFSHDSLHAVKDQQEMQEEMLSDILEIARIVKNAASQSNQIVQSLGESTQIVNTAIGEISASTQTTASNIQEQTVMTQTIQQSINQTVQYSEKMVVIADNSSEAIGSGLQIMGNLKEQSAYIASANAAVVNSMEKLQDKMKEVQDIAGIIFSISSQTNLLALNASIESARAGEAGKGFAVVAEEIRHLAEQTRNSTENIKRIIDELNQNAAEATGNVKESIVSAENQGSLITTASQSFEKINEDVSTLSGHIEEIDKMLSELAEANNQIVDNISQLSATTEEITAGSEEVSAISEKNLQNAESTKEYLKEVLHTTERFDKYLEN